MEPFQVSIAYSTILVGSKRTKRIRGKKNNLFYASNKIHTVNNILPLVKIKANATTQPAPILLKRSLESAPSNIAPAHKQHIISLPCHVSTFRIQTFLHTRHLCQLAANPNRLRDNLSHDTTSVIHLKTTLINTKFILTMYSHLGSGAYLLLALHPVPIG